VQGAGVVTVVVNNATNNNISSSIGSKAGAGAAAAARVLFITLAYLLLVDYKVVSSTLNYSRSDLLLKQCKDLLTI